MKKLAGIVFAVALVVTANVAVITPAHAQTASTTNIATLMETLKSLLAKVSELQAELTKVKGEVKEAEGEIKSVIKEGLKEGMTDEDIKKIQELLASDSEVYPEGLTTGYFGSLTKAALKRFQVKHNLAETGEINEETKKLLDTYLNERFGDNVPQGLLRAPGIFKKVQDSICDRTGKGGAWGLFCKDHVKDVDEDEEEDEDEDEVEYEVEVEVEDGETTVSFELDGDSYEITVESTDLDEILEAIADELDEDLEDVDEDFVDEVEKALEEALEEAEESSDEENAENAIDDAQDAIDEVQSDIDAADEDVDTDEAQEALNEAEELLEDAQDALDDEDFNEAEELAEEAEEKAEEAADLLEEATEDAA